MKDGAEVEDEDGDSDEVAQEDAEEVRVSKTEDTLSKLCEESCEGPQDVCQVANFLFPNGFSCAGTLAAIQRLEPKVKETEGCLQAKMLKTSGGFHTKLMQPAREKLLEALQEALPKMKPPRCDVYMNLTGKKIAAGTAPSEIVPLLADQLVNCVLWEPAVLGMIKDGVSEFYECGPMKQLKSMMKRIDPGAFGNTTTIQQLQQLAKSPTGMNFALLKVTYTAYGDRRSFFVNQAINLLYVVYGGAILYPRMLFTNVVTKEMTSFPKRPFFIMGTLDSLGTFLTCLGTAYTPGSITPLLNQLLIPFTMLVSAVWLRVRSRWQERCGAFFIVLGASISVIPKIVDVPDESSALQNIAVQSRWYAILFYALSNFPMAASSCYKESTFENHHLDVWYLTQWVSIWQFLGMSFAEVVDSFVDGWTCYSQQDPDCARGGAFLLLTVCAVAFVAMPSIYMQHQRMKFYYWALLVLSAGMLLASVVSWDFRQILHMLPLCGLLLLSALRMSGRTGIDFYNSSHMRWHIVSTLAICLCMALSYIDELRSRSWVGFAEVAILAPELLIMRRRERSPARTLQECLFKVWLGTGVIMSVMSLAIPEHMADVLDEWGAISLILEKIILGALCTRLADKWVRSATLPLRAMKAQLAL
eukprot:s3782_g7.t2